MTTEPDLPVDPPLRRPPPPLPRRRRRVPIFLWILLGLSLLVNFLALGGGFSSNWMEVPAREFPEIDATLAWGNPGEEARVAVLRLEGVIRREGAQTLFGKEIDPVTRLLTEIQAVTVSDYDAILLEVDSPGGGVTASDDIYRALMAFKESDPARKIVVHVQDMAASGGYYAALAGDRIVAQPTSLVGSIGVMMSAVNLHNLGEKLGIEGVTLASSENKALLNSLEPVDPEHLEILQSVVDGMYDRFRGLVLEHRPFDEAFAAEHHLLDGRVFTLPAARELGLVDDVGYGDTARGVVMELLDVQGAAFYEVSFSSPGFGWLTAKLPEVRLPMWPRSRMMYLWTP